MSNPKKLELKKETVKTIAQKLKDAKGVYLTDFQGITVEQVNELRRTFDKDKVEYKVVKNSILHFALKEVFPDYDFDMALKGNTSVVFSFKDPVSPAKTINEFFKKYKNPKAKRAIVEGKIFDQKSVEKLADIPSKEELMRNLVGSMQSPIYNFVYVLNGIISNFVYTVDAIKQKKEGN